MDLERVAIINTNDLCEMHEELGEAYGKINAVGDYVNAEQFPSVDVICALLGIKRIARNEAKSLESV